MLRFDPAVEHRISRLAKRYNVEFARILHLYNHYLPLEVNPKHIFITLRLYCDMENLCHEDRSAQRQQEFDDKWNRNCPRDPDLIILSIAEEVIQLEVSLVGMLGKLAERFKRPDAEVVKEYKRILVEEEPVPYYAYQILYSKLREKCQNRTHREQWI